MEALVKNYFRHAKTVNCNREIILVEGNSARCMNLEPLVITLARKAREAHFNIIEDNIRRYGKVKNLH